MCAISTYYKQQIATNYQHTTFKIFSSFSHVEGHRDKAFRITCFMASTRLLRDVVCSINTSAALSWSRRRSTSDLASAKTFSRVHAIPVWQIQRSFNCIFKALNWIILLWRFICTTHSCVCSMQVLILLNQWINQPLIYISITGRGDVLYKHQLFGKGKTDGSNTTKKSIWPWPQRLLR